MGILDRRQDNAEVDPMVGDRLHDFLVGHCLDDHMYAWMLHAKCRDGLCHKRISQHRRRRQSHHAGLQVLQVFGESADGFYSRCGADDLGQKETRIERRHESPSLAQKERKPKALLGLLQSLANGRLGNMQAFRRRGDAASLNHASQQFQGSDTESHNLLLMETYLFTI